MFVDGIRILNFSSIPTTNIMQKKKEKEQPCIFVYELVSVVAHDKKGKDDKKGKGWKEKEERRKKKRGRRLKVLDKRMILVCYLSWYK